LHGLRRGGLLLVNTAHGQLPIRPPDDVRTVLVDATSLALRLALKVLGERSSAVVLAEKRLRGVITRKKPMFEIVATHGIDYS